MICRVVLTEEAQQKLSGVRNPVIREQIIKRIEVLIDHPEAGKSLRGILAPYRLLRIGRNRYRIIYRFIKDEALVIMITIGLRKEKDFGEVYKSLERLVKSAKGKNER
jgi:mRNA-degrading endonuclease RelE of RelBE toxin-antitoxin system